MELQLNRLKEQATFSEKQTKSIMPHQAEALKSLYKASKTASRYTCTMACGTGKTLVGLWHAEQLQAKKILVLLPSLGLLNQTLQEWLENTCLKDFRYICVCSDQTISQLDEDTLHYHSGDFNFPVTTDKNNIRSFVKSSTIGTTIIFSTYHSAPIIGEALTNNYKFDLVLFDEAHKTVGQFGKMFSYALHDKNIFSEKRLFLTATPRIIKNAHDKDYSASMDNEDLYGPTAYSLNFGEAVKLKIIVDYKIIISVVTSKSVSKLLERSHVKIKNKKIETLQVAHIIAINNILQKHSVSKCISFHSDVAKAKSFNDLINENTLNISSNFNSFHVNGGMTSQQRSINIKSFGNSKRSILTNARCLTEGIDVPIVDMVAFLCNKKSRVDIVQAVGRAVRKAPDKNIGYVLIPFYIENDEKLNEVLDQKAKYSDYSDIWYILKMLSDYDSLLHDVTNVVNLEPDKISSEISSKVSIINDNNVSIDKLTQGIATLTIKSVRENWYNYYSQLKTYYQKYGHSHVLRRNDENQQLANWCKNQRIAYRKNDLNTEKISLLNKLDFIWDIYDSIWDHNYCKLIEFFSKYGHSDVSKSDDRELLKWVRQQRMLCSSNKLLIDRKMKLQKLDFIWDYDEHSWELNYKKFVLYKKTYNTLNLKFADNKLKNWIFYQKKSYREGRLSNTRISLLKNLGLCFDTKNELWMKNYEKLLNFFKKNGHSYVSKNDVDDKFFKWVNNQRSQYNKFNNNKILMDEEKVSLLEKVGFSVCDISNFNWMQNYESLKKYCENQKKLQNINKKLKNWINTQRSLRKKNKLSQDKIDLLNHIGFIWDCNQENWMEKYAELREFKNTYGHVNVSTLNDEFKGLGSWLLLQKVKFKKSKLDNFYYEKLNDLGVEWDDRARSIWIRRFYELREYKSIHGHCNVSAIDPTYKSLGVWVALNRTKKRKNELDDFYIEKLNSIGFEWDVNQAVWLEKYALLKKYKSENGHCNVPLSCKYEDMSFGCWVSDQRKLLKKGLLKPSRVLLLEKIDF